MYNIRDNFIWICSFGSRKLFAKYDRVGNPPGKYIQALNDTAGTIPALIAIVLFLIGIAILSKAYKNLK